MWGLLSADAERQMPRGKSILSLITYLAGAGQLPVMDCSFCGRLPDVLDFFRTPAWGESANAWLLSVSPETLRAPLRVGVRKLCISSDMGMQGMLSTRRCRSSTDSCAPSQLAQAGCLTAQAVRQV